MLLSPGTRPCAAPSARAWLARPWAIGRAVPPATQPARGRSTACSPFSSEQNAKRSPSSYKYSGLMPILSRTSQVCSPRSGEHSRAQHRHRAVAAAAHHGEVAPGVALHRQQPLELLHRAALATARPPVQHLDLARACRGGEHRPCEGAQQRPNAATFQACLHLLARLSGAMWRD